MRKVQNRGKNEGQKKRERKENRGVRVQRKRLLSSKERVREKNYVSLAIDQNMERRGKMPDIAAS